MVFVFPKLPYEYNALEPFVDPLTMELHHTKHHQTYVDKTNQFIQTAREQDGEMQGKDIVCVVQNATSECLRNNAGGHYNHSAPYGPLKERIEQDFGSLEKMKQQFNAAAATRFGSGWVWLGVKHDGSLAITPMMNQDNPLTMNAQEAMIPILGLDVWEHAYYLKYQNRRTEYIAAFWDVANWDQVVAYYDEFASKHQPIPIPGN